MSKAVTDSAASITGSMILSLFEIGKTYTIYMVRRDGKGQEVWHNWKVAAVDRTCVQFDDGSIVNTASSAFVKAEPEKH